MKYNEYLATTINEQLNSGAPVVLISIVSLQGSSPRHSGTKMVVNADGKSYGTVGGSLLETTAIKESRTALAQRESRLMDFDLDGANAYATGMICGGKTVLLLDFMAPTEENHAFCQNWHDSLLSGGDFFFLTCLKEDGNRIHIPGHGLLFPDGKLLGNCPLTESDIENIKAELHHISATTVLTVSGGSVIIDPMRKLKTLYCFGAGHVAQPTAHIASLTGFRVVVVDDRAEYANTERFPDADDIGVIQDYNHALQGLEIDRDSFIVILTHGHRWDRVVLEQALKTSAGYIGMIGSESKRDAIFQALLSQGVNRAQLERVHSPIGLAIGAETPEEIAVSIVAELIREREKQQA